MPSANPILVDLNQMENDFQKLFELLETSSKRESIFYTPPKEIRLIDFCQQQLKPILYKMQFKLEVFQKRFLRDIKDMKDFFKSTKGDLRLSATSSVRRSSNRDSSLKNSVVSNTKNSSKTVEVSDRINIKPDVASQNVALNKLVTNDEIKNALIAKNVFCVTCAKNDIISSVLDNSMMVIWKFLFAQQHDMYELEGDYLLTGAREYNLYTISILDMATSSPVCLMSKATLTKSWLWHRKDHLCSTCERGKSKKASHPPKLVSSSHSNLELLPMDLWDKLRVAYRSMERVYSMNTLSKEDLDDLFEAMYDEYFKKKTRGSSIVSSSDETTAPNLLKRDLSKVESSTALDPSNMHEFHQVQPSTYIWIKAHSLKQVIGDPSKPLMTRNRIKTDHEVCMYALTVSINVTKNINEVMSDHSWIESMQDELHQFKRLDVWELVPQPDGKNIIAVKWLWKNKR
ncbi:retrovirus-related pol polyprotein from transposon TNT 1-94 [Tanacetum coccineum]